MYKERIVISYADRNHEITGEVYLHQEDFEKYDWGSMKRMVENNEYDCLLDWVRTETGSNDNHFLGAKIYEDNRRMTNELPY